MSTQAHYSVRDSFGGADDYDEPRSFELSAADRIGPPLRSRGARILRRITFALSVIGIGAGAGWVLQEWPDLPARITAQVTEVVAAMTRQPTIVEERPVSAMVPNSASAPVEPIAPLPVESATAASAAVGLAYASNDPSANAAAAATVDEPLTRLPTPKPDPADPNQKKAVAAGLHPGLSPALLARLTETDYRNAAIAIKTALAETPADRELIWPREAKANLARFQVRFVRGADGDCRRYVVVVLKDGWKTTALPMEKCRT